MAGSSNFSYDKSNPFFDVSDDVDDAEFLKNSRPAYQGSTIQERREQLLLEKRRIEQRTVESSFRSISLLQESEDIGNATAQELTQQREQLENTEKRLDEINSSLRTSQKHIQSIKSVFGSIKNYFGGANKEQPAKSSSNGEADKSKTTVPKSRSELSKILESSKEASSSGGDYESHPATRLRSESIPTSREVDDILDKNLDEMGHFLTKIKGLGLGLQEEIETQNELIARVAQKTENADFRIEKQNKEMNRILKK